MSGKTVKKAILFILAVILVFGCMVPAGFASGTKKMLEAWYMNVKIISGGREVYTETEPFIVDGTTYVPVRMMANIFNKDIAWDPVNYVITVTDKPGSDVGYLNMQLIMKDNEIKYLEDRIKSLEGKSSSTTDMEDLEDDLNYYYDEYKGVDFDITLSGTKSKITVKIEFSLKKDRTAWNKLTTNNIKSYLQDICDDILDEYPKANINGYFKDNSGTTSSKMYQFSTTSRGEVLLDDDDYADDDLYDLEDDLNDMFYDYFRDFDVDIELEGDQDDITFYVYIDYDRYEDEWDDLRDRDIEYFMEDIYCEIEDVFNKADIIGYIYDFDGKTRLARYDTGRSPEFTRYQ
jgi:hypothetical protein